MAVAIKYCVVEEWEVSHQQYQSQLLLLDLDFWVAVQVSSSSYLEGKVDPLKLGVSEEKESLKKNIYTCT